MPCSINQQQLLEQKAEMLGITDAHLLPYHILKREVEYASGSRSERATYQQQNNRWAIANWWDDPTMVSVDIPVRG